MAEIVKTEAVPETKEADPEIKEAVAAEVVEVVKVRASPEVLAILMGPQIKPAGYIGNLASLRTSVWIQLSAPGRTFLHQNLNQINEKLTNSTLKYMTRCMHSLTKKYTLST